MTAKKAYSRVALALLVVAVVTTIVQVVASVVASLLIDGGFAFAQASWFTWVVTFVPFYLFGLPSGIAILRTLPATQKEDVKLGGKNFFLFLLMCFALMYFGNLIGTGLSWLFSGGNAVNPLNDFAFEQSWIKILVIVIVAPLVEEFLFRKLLIDRCVRYGEKPAILFSGLTFGLFHMNLFQFFYAFGLGLLFAYVYTRTRRLRYPVLFHMIVNFLGSAFAPFLLSQLDMQTIEQMQTGVVDEAAIMAMLPALILFFVYALALIGLSIAGLVMLILRVRRLVFVPAEEELARGEHFKSVYCSVSFILFFLLCVGTCVVSLINPV